jgi:hypothetical protein
MEKKTLDQWKEYIDLLPEEMLPRFLYNIALDSDMNLIQSIRYNVFFTEEGYKEFIFVYITSRLHEELIL